jgi:Ca2+/Na+ antiporter
LFFSATGSAVFSVIEKESISWSSVLRTYLLSIGVCTVLFGFAAFAFWLANGGLNMWQVVIFLCLVLAIVTFLSWKTRRDQGLLEATWEPDHLEAVNEYRNSLKEEERKKQKESQLLPTWLYTIVGLAGSATGYVLAMNMGWRFTVLKFVVFLSALPGLAILLGLDRYLVKKRAKKRASASEDWQKQNRDSWQKPE